MALKLLERCLPVSRAGGTSAGPSASILILPLNWCKLPVDLKTRVVHTPFERCLGNYRHFCGTHPCVPGVGVITEPRTRLLDILSVGL
jgi:hypothetical protein